MERFIEGNLVVIPFPFSDLTNAKKRPALVLATLEGDDLILCQITRYANDSYAIPIDKEHFKKGYIFQRSYVRPNRIFTADKKIIIKKVRTVTSSFLSSNIEMIKSILDKDH